MSVALGPENRVAVVSSCLPAKIRQQCKALKPFSLRCPSIFSRHLPQRPSIALT